MSGIVLLFFLGSC